MAFRETEQVDDFTKPSRQRRGSGGKKHKNRDQVRAPKEPYHRQRFSMNDVEDDRDDGEGNY